MTFGLFAIPPTASGTACAAASGWARVEPRGRRQIRQPLQGIAQPLSRYSSRCMALSAALTALPLSAQEVFRLPSGRSAHLHEVIEGGEADIRRRYVSGGFDPKGMDPEVLLEDMAFLCKSSGLGRGAADATARSVVISLADRAAPFGLLDPDLQQVFEAFTSTGDSCIWEGF